MTKANRFSDIAGNAASAKLDAELLDLRQSAPTIKILGQAIWRSRRMSSSLGLASYP